MKQLRPFIIFLFLLTIVQAQPVTLTQGLFCKLPDAYRRSVVGVDPIEAQLLFKQRLLPKAGQAIAFSDGTSGQWEPMTCDSAGWFDDPRLRLGYMHFTYQASQDTILLLHAMGHEMAYINGVPRTGNRYQDSETFASWGPRFDYCLLPIQLSKGINELLFQGGRTARLKVNLLPLPKAIFFNERDITLPDLVIGRPIDSPAAIVLINATQKPLSDLLLVSSVSGGAPVSTAASLLQPMSVRKIGFKLQGAAPLQAGESKIQLCLINSKDPNHVLDRIELAITIRKPDEPCKYTFLSDIDSSVQYYAVNPARDQATPASLVLSVHGAGVEAIGQAGAYGAKTWAHIVCPTNRRPYGFNWEDWGRLDAMEVLRIARRTLNVDSSRIYLTGHSMGGHGAWILGALYPDQFAALGPSAGWLSFWTYRVREELADSAEIQRFMKRINLASKTLDLVDNYRNLGLYILHGAADDNVSVDQSRQMVEKLKPFHNDFIYFEQPDAGHWWDLSAEPGADCVDWPPLFDFFSRHCRPLARRLRQVDFLTPDPGISSRYYWLTIAGQKKQLQASTASIRFDPGRNLFVGSTVNVSRLSFDLTDLTDAPSVSVDLDSQKISGIDRRMNKIYLENQSGKWFETAPPSLRDKGPHRNGLFKDLFRHGMIFVFGTHGTLAENQWAFAKARYDAEQFWYQGNGSIAVMRDDDFSPARYPDRNIILFGNSATNSVWPRLLQSSPVQIGKGWVQVGARKLSGSNYACLFLRPRPDSDIACVGAVSGSGLIGMRLTNTRPYLFPGYSFPDLLLFNESVVQHGTQGIAVAGFFGLNWSVETGEFIWNANL